MNLSRYKNFKNKRYENRGKKEKRRSSKSKAIAGFKAVLVDFDGTLVNSLPALIECYFAFLQKRGRKGSMEEFASLIGPTIHEIVLKLKQLHGLDEDVTTLFNDYYSRIETAYTKKVMINRSVLAMVKNLKARGLKAVIVTSAPYTLVESFLEQRSLKEIFPVIIACEPEEPSKPHPALYLRALDVLGINGEEAIVIEDSESGIQSAQSAEISFIIKVK